MAPISRLLAGEAEEEFNIRGGVDPTYVLILVMVSVLFSVLLQAFWKRPFIPHSVVLLLFGLVLGILFENTTLGALSDSIENWLSLHPNTILYVLLPPIIFESAMNMDFHVFWKSLWQSVLLAVPGVFIQIGLIILVVMYILPYDWNFTIAATLAAMLSATDPVAVVAIIKELGAPKSLGTIIEGESLLNDGVAYTIFLFFFEELEGGERHAWQFVTEFIYASGVGSIVGYLIGLVGLIIMGIIFDQEVVEMSFTLLIAWGTWMVADGLLEASGVIAVVTVGLVFSCYFSSVVSSKCKEATVAAWELIGFLANTLIFVYSGVVIVNFSFEEDIVEARDYGYLILFYILLNIIRAFTVLVLYPALKRTGYGLDARSAIIASYSGLRGAVGLVLGLQVVTSAQAVEEHDERTVGLVMFYMGGIVVLTLIINGSTVGWLLRKLRLNRSSAAAKHFFLTAVSRLSEHMDETMATLRASEHLSGANWIQVMDTLPKLNTTMPRDHCGEATRTISRSRSSLNLRSRYITLTNLEVEDDQLSYLLPAARCRFLNLVKSQYQHEFEAGAISSRPSIELLLDVASEAQDNCGARIDEWGYLAFHCEVPKWVGLCKVRVLKHMLVEYRLFLGYQLASSFVRAHTSVVDEFRLICTEDEIFKRITEENEENVKGAKEYLRLIDSEFADISRTVKTRWATEYMLVDLANYAEQLKRHGEIEDQELNLILNLVERGRFKVFRNRFRTTSPMERAQVLRTSELLIGASKKEADTLLDLVDETTFVNGEVVATAGKTKGRVFVVGSGEVFAYDSQNREEPIFRFHSGDAFNCAAFCTRKNIACHTFVAVGSCRLFFAKNGALASALQDFQGGSLEKNIYKRGAVEVWLKEHGDLSAFQFSKKHRRMMRVMRNADLWHPFQGETMFCGQGVGLLFEGQVSHIDEKELEHPREPVCEVEATDNITFSQRSVMLWLPSDVAWLLRFRNMREHVPEHLQNQMVDLVEHQRRREQSGRRINFSSILSPRREQSAYDYVEAASPASNKSFGHRNGDERLSMPSNDRRSMSSHERSTRRASHR